MMVMFVIKMINSDDDCKDYDSDNIDHDRDCSGDQFSQAGGQNESFCSLNVFAGRG